MTKLINRTSALFLLLLSVIPLALLSVQTFQLQTEPSLVWWLAALCVILWYGAFGKLRFLLSMILSLGLLLLAFHLYSVDLSPELSDFIGQIREVYYGYLIGEGESISGAEQPSTAIVLLLFFVFAFYFSQTLCAARSRIALTLVGFLPLFLCNAAVNGHMEVNVVFCLSLFVILLIAGGNMYQDEGDRGIVIWTVSIPASLLIMICLLIADPVNYSFDEEDINRSRRFDQLSKTLSEMVRREPEEPPKETVEPPSETERRPDYGQSSWSEKNGEMNMKSYFNSYAETLLQVKADYTGCMYLRRSSYGDYAGTRWLADDGGTDVSSLPFAAKAAEAAGFSASEATIRLAHNADVYLLPYFCPLGEENDVYVRSAGEREYTVSYYPCGNAVYQLCLSGEDAALEQQYRDYAYERYTVLPENTEFSAKYILQEAGLDPSDENIVWKIASYVQNSGTYNINTSASQSSDYAIYFLTQSHRGYCIHFASAAAVLYRAAGIPARIAGGYMFNVKAGEFVDVYPRNEHAWVEIYVDGLGWVPIETTAPDLSGEDGDPSSREMTMPSPFAPDSEISGTASDGPAATLAPIPIRPAAPRPTPIPTPVPTPTPAVSAPPLQVPTPEPSAEAAIEETRPPEPSDTPTPTPTPEDSSQLTVEAERRSLSPWFALFLIPPAAFLIRQLRLLLRKRKIQQKDRKKSAVALWKEAKKLCRGEQSVPQEIRSAAERAAFGRNAPSKAEIQRSAQSLRTLENQTFRDSRGLRRLRLLLRGRLFR